MALGHDFLLLNEVNLHRDSDLQKAHFKTFGPGHQVSDHRVEVQPVLSLDEESARRFLVLGIIHAETDVYQEGPHTSVLRARFGLDQSKEVVYELS